MILPANRYKEELPDDEEFHDLVTMSWGSPSWVKRVMTKFNLQGYVWPSNRDAGGWRCDDWVSIKYALQYE